jgi:hypothetical protein
MAAELVELEEAAFAGVIIRPLPGSLAAQGRPWHGNRVS